MIPDPSGAVTMISALPAVLEVAEKLNLRQYLPHSGVLDKKELKELQQRYRSLLVEAQAQYDALKIRSGENSIGDYISGIRLGQESQVPAKIKIEPTLSISQFAASITQSMVHERMRADINATQALVHAAQLLSEDTSPSSDKSVQEDWLQNWKRAAENISEENLQKLWGALLAGEIRSPGTFSRRTMHFVQMLSPDEAKQVSRLMRLAINRMKILYFNDMTKLGWNYIELVDMETLGVISGVTGSGIHLKIDEAIPEGKSIRYRYHGRDIILTRDKPLLKHHLRAYPLTAVGTELCYLGEYLPDDLYLEMVVKEYASTGLSYRTVNVVEMGT